MFGDWLRRQRLARGFGQDELSRQVACTTVMIRKLEAGSRQPSRQLAELLAACFAVPEDEREAFIAFARLAPALTAAGASHYEADAAPWRSLRRRHTNLAVPPTPLLGREHEVATVQEQLLGRRTRLLTITGPPGVGKTRLAMATASTLAVAEHFTDGVFFVPLAPLTDPGRVISAIAVVLGLKEGGSTPLAASLGDYLSGKRLLLLLDNFEHVVEAAVAVAELLSRGPWLKMLVTSREELALRGERVFRLTPLALPATSDQPLAPADAGRSAWPSQLSVARVSRVAAVALFAERAADAQPDFALRAANVVAVAQICIRLEGLPLAIELAAARCGELAPEQLLARLAAHGQLAELGGAIRDLPPRQRTLRAAISWSYELLAAAEQWLFRQLSVFVDGCSPAAAGAVWNQAGTAGPTLAVAAGDPLTTLAAFARKGLLVRDDERAQPRFAMLEAIREYAWERLQLAGEDEQARRLHTRYYLQLAEQAAPHLTGPDQVNWLELLETEHANLRAALAWALELQSPGVGLASRQDDGAAQLPAGASPATPPLLIALRLAVALRWFWANCGHLSEGRAWLERVLAGLESLPASARTAHLLALQARVLGAVGALAFDQGDYDQTCSTQEQALLLYRALDDKDGIAAALNTLGRTAWIQGDYAIARALIGQSLQLMRELGNKLGVSVALTNLALVARALGELDAARRLQEECLALKRELGDKRAVATALNNLGITAVEQDRIDDARTLQEEALAIRRALNDQHGIAYSLVNLSRLAAEQGQYVTAGTQLKQALAVVRAVGDRVIVAECLQGLATVAAGLGQPRPAAQLYGAAAALRDALRAPLPLADRSRVERQQSMLCAVMGETACQAAWQEGQALAIEQAIEQALLIG